MKCWEGRLERWSRAKWSGESSALVTCHTSLSSSRQLVLSAGQRVGDRQSYIGNSARLETPSAKTGDGRVVQDRTACACFHHDAGHAAADGIDSEDRNSAAGNPLSSRFVRILEPRRGQSADPRGRRTLRADRCVPGLHERCGKPGGRAANGRWSRSFLGNH